VAVDNLDLRVFKGEIFGLLGPNGAGKTTTVGMLTTLVIPTSGRATVAGMDVVAQPQLVKQIIGVVSQVNNLDRSLTVWENLYYHGLFFGMSSRESRSSADSLLVQFRLQDRARADVATISGGMARRLQVARALMHKPSVLFLDEPTTGLDPQTRITLWEILRTLNSQGQTILMTTHYMEEADSMCDRLAIMDHGKILALDTPEKLKESAGADSIITIAAGGNLEALEQLIQKNLAGVAQSRRMDGRLQISVKDMEGVLPKLLAAAAESSVSISDLTVSKPTLETVFIKLTGKELRD
jgi:ABC-2 type transport system ATP-binding protein